MDYSAVTGQQTRQPEVTEERAIAQRMSSLASQIGDLRTVARNLANRVSPMIPGGSPFEMDRIAKAAPGANVPTPVRSPHCEQLDSRIYELRELTENLESIVRSIEI